MTDNDPYRRRIEELSLQGVEITVTGGQFLVRRRAIVALPYTTDDIDDALRHGQGLADQELPPPPLGPLGKGNKARQWRAKMYRHNNMIAGQRRRAARAVAAVHAEDAPEWAPYDEEPV